MRTRTAAIPPGYSCPATVAWFIAGGLVTALFSGSLAALAAHATPAEVLATGMVVPSFTWIVQLGVSGVGLSPRQCRLY